MEREGEIEKGEGGRGREREREREEKRSDVVSASVSCLEPPWSGYHLYSLVHAVNGRETDL